MEKATDPHQTGPIHPVHQGEREATLLQKELEGSTAGGTIMGDEGVPERKTTLTPA